MSLFIVIFRSAAKNKTESKTEIVVSFATDIELCHKSNMVDKLNADSWCKKHRGSFARKVFVAYNIIENNAKSGSNEWIDFSLLLETVITV